MVRLLILVLIAILLWVLLERLLEKLAAGLRSSAGRSARGAGGPRQRSPEALVRCDACGVYVPRSRAIPASAGHAGTFCSEACRRASQSRAS